ncbi:UvrD-helicase domain-containing protein [Parahaliea mediterranea]|uniref:DNA 3'-5' helicase n=1 Tax=Parahaliea mediterranea TaxID=651086 RepID=A0A939DG79_9GAMM|nr:UvrD-helicase domain-containing protein [Parahaliea mediterranea]MBN7797693.1 UvrD-helicase domain-containing protein [Parahaliea mediterranea]
MSIVDAQQREAALDPLQSFCISAPAGSGKTELLIQRFLSLLARVQRPEQILAITFTRKAAAEMRERVLLALREAREGKPCDSPHQQRTRDLATAALAVDGQQNWQLLGNSSRLNIRTIDGFCAALTRQMPILSEFGAQAGAVDDAGPLYAEAVAELFAMVESEHPVAADLRALMLHFDNNWDKLAELLQSLLARRDQWLPYVGLHHSPGAAEERLLHTLHAVIRGVLDGLRQRLGPYLGELYELQCYAAQNLQATPPAAAPAAAIGDLDDWRGLRRLLLTKSGGWRGRLTKAEGFPAGKGRAQEMKQRMAGVLGELSHDDSLKESLQELDVLPELEADTTSWRLVLQLSHVLPVLAAQLLLVFQRRGAVDHSQVAQSALQALGDDEAPTDLALRLDYRIEHILVDEFQDTAINQFELVRRLTRGWGEHNAVNPDAPRTFLIVGDGMQSIYGFRDANVGLFLQARDRGFNGVVPRYLELRSNFRSEAGVVDWVNRVFGQAFPAVDDIARGEVSFSAAAAVKPAAADAAVAVAVFHGEGAPQAEIDHVCDGVAAALAAEPGGSVAVLGRSRSQLQGIVAGLRGRGIAFAAQDMDRLQHSPVVLDLMTLVRALANPADRVAWAALLRAPWCGLTLADLHAAARAGAQGDMPLPPLTAPGGDDDPLAGLSADGRERLAHLRAGMGWALARRDRLSQRAWLEQAWLQLGGPATATSETALADAERFFQLIEQGELEGRILDIPWLQAQVERLFADTGGDGARVQVMTLHKAKGLEFDHVFIPALARGAGQDRRPLLLWDEYSDAGGERGFLLAADDHSKPGEAGLYNFLGQQRKRKQALENTRLLYVGATRAVRRLVLSATLAEDPKSGDPRPPGGNTLLGCIWPAVADQARYFEAREVSPAAALAPIPPLRRLRALSGGARETPGDASPANRPGSVDNRLERHTGTAVHQLLEMLAAGPELPGAPGEDEREACRWALTSLGLAGADLARALEMAMASLQRTLADASAGRWLLRADHPGSACELPLTRVDATGRIRDIVIDRTFVDADTGERWIVDYKTSQPAPGVSTAEFLREEGERYREQLQGYREAMAELGPEPLRCALYFTALGHLHPLDD